MVEVRDRRILFLIVAALIFARGIGGRSPYFLLYMAVVVAIVSYYWVSQGLLNLSCTYSVDRRRLTAGEPLDVKLRIYNEWYLPLPWLEITDNSPLGRDPITALISVPIVGSRIWRYQIPAIRRGRYHMGPIGLRSGDVFGLFETTREIYGDVTVLVMPRLRTITGLSIPPRQPFGHYRTRERAFEDPSNIAEVRPFQPGDHRRKIHWWTSARKGELYAKEYELTATSELCVICDLNRDAYRGIEPLLAEDTVIESAASVVHYGLGAGHDVMYVGYGASRQYVRLGRGRRRFNEFMETLATASATGSIPLVEAVQRESRQLSARSTIVIITPDISYELSAALFRLKRAGFGIAAIVVSDSEDRDEWLLRYRAAHIPLYWLRSGDSLADVTGGVHVALH